MGKVANVLERRDSVVRSVEHRELRKVFNALQPSEFVVADVQIAQGTEESSAAEFAHNS